MTSVDKRTDMYCELINSLAKIHAVDIGASGLDTYGKQLKSPSELRDKGYVARQVKVS